MFRYDGRAVVIPASIYKSDEEGNMYIIPHSYIQDLQNAISLQKTILRRHLGTETNGIISSEDEETELNETRTGCYQ